MIHDHDESATDINALNLNIVLEFDLAGTFEFSKNASAPNIHDSFFGDGCTRVPSRYLLELVRSIALTHLIIWHSWIDSHGTELVLVRIVSNLSEVVGSKGPKLPTIPLLGIVSEEESMVLAAGDLVNGHVL